jgi:Putative addiction module component
MMSAAEDLYRQALALPEDERRDLAAKLVASLTAEDPLDTPAFVAELDRRDAAIASGESTLVPSADVHAAMRARRDGRRATG